MATVHGPIEAIILTHVHNGRIKPGKRGDAKGEVVQLGGSDLQMLETIAKCDIMAKCNVQPREIFIMFKYVNRNSTPPKIGSATDFVVRGTDSGLDKSRKIWDYCQGAIQVPRECPTRPPQAVQCLYVARVCTACNKHLCRSLPTPVCNTCRTRLQRQQGGRQHLGPRFSNKPPATQHAVDLRQQHPQHFSRFSVS